MHVTCWENQDLQKYSKGITLRMEVPRNYIGRITGKHSNTKNSKSDVKSGTLVCVANGTPDGVSEEVSEEFSEGVPTGAAAEILHGGVSKTEFKKSFLRNLGRILLPKKAENWFLGSKEDEEFLKKYSETDIPTYGEITENYKNGLYNKEELKRYSEMRLRYDMAKSKAEHRKSRNAIIGQELVDLGSAGVGGGGAVATKAGINLLKPIFGRKIAQWITQGALGGGLGGAAHGFGTGLVQEDVNPITQGLIEGGSGAVTGAGIGYGASQIGKNLALSGIRNNVEDALRQQHYFDDYIEGLNNVAVSKQGLSMSDIRALKIGDYGQKRQGLEYNFIGKNIQNTDNDALNNAQKLFEQGVDNDDLTPEQLAAKLKAKATEMRKQKTTYAKGENMSAATMNQLMKNGSDIPPIDFVPKDIIIRKTVYKEIWLDNQRQISSSFVERLASKNKNTKYMKMPLSDGFTYYAHIKDGLPIFYKKVRTK